MDWLSGQKAENRTSDNVNVQGSEAWLKWRNKGLGSSDAAVLLGWSPWKTIEQLYLEKLGEWKPVFGAAQQAAMDRGKELEPKIRAWFENEVGHKFPDDIAEDLENPFMRASYDGINRKYINPEDNSVGRIIEIKAPNAKDHALACAGMVPEKYQPQVAWLMLLANAQWATYISFGTCGTYATVSVRRDTEIQRELFFRALLFWGCLQKKTGIPKEGFEKWKRPLTPLDLTESEHPTVSEQEIESLVAETLKAQTEADAADAKFQVLQEKLKKVLGDEEKRQCGEAVFGWQTRKGNVDYGAIPQLQGVELDQYRKDDIRAFYFKRVKT